MPRTRHRHARVYQMLRSAHLERAHELEPASILYVERRYDFDASLAHGLDLIQAGNFAAPLILFRSSITICEINEPLMRSRLARTALSILAVRLSSRLNRSKSAVVTYAIENLNPFDREAPLLTSSKDASGRAFARQVFARLKFVARRRLDSALSVAVARQVDRIAYGTPGARKLYDDVLGRDLAGAIQTSIAALPAPCNCGPFTKDRGEVVFLGAFEVRKGFDRLLASWGEIQSRVPTARLVLIGKGALLDDAIRFAESRDDVDLMVDPPRTTIHEVLRRAAVLVLLSRRRPRWREQVGLPLVEGLAHGCKVVTTDETGLADWLSMHGHWVLDRDAPTETTARAIAEALADQRDVASVLADLPDVDGRLAADRWLFDRGHG